MLTNPIDLLPRTSNVTIKRFKSIDINTYKDLIDYFPFRYEDYSIISKINQLQLGETVTVKGEIIKASNIFTRTGLKIQKIIIKDNTGILELIWFNQPFLISLFKPGQILSASGTIETDLKKLVLKPISYEIISSYEQPTIHTGRIVPIYSEKNGLSSKLIREKIFAILSPLLPSCTLSQKDGNAIPDILPREIVSYNDLVDEQTAYLNIHFPQNTALEKKARQRLAFDELFIIQLSTAIIKKEWSLEKTGHPLILDRTKQNKLDKFIKDLPFELTTDQKKVIQEILADLKKPSPMNRLLQGEVGSGKTVVSAIASYLCQLNGLQTLFMAPTEILAEQHFQTISSLFKEYPIKIGLQTGSKKITPVFAKASHFAETSRDKLTGKKLRIKKYDIIIGTQALIQEKIKFNKVGLVIVDEQHRFGVRQRALIKEKGINPHLLSMTATPIPRTVALTLYGELDLSIINELPKNRLPIKSYLVPKSKRQSAYNWIKKLIKNEKAQIFLVCPFIEESTIETMKTIKAATIEYKSLKNDIFKDCRVSLVHGRMKSKEKNQIMSDFKDHKIDLLVATSVVEVGIDIPNAVVIVIEGAERYGLAQLHQLRGRVGRGEKQSYCLLFTEAEGSDSLDRLALFVKNTDGNMLAEYDLKHRGAGQIYGVKQHGYTDLKIASLSDYDLIKKTKSASAYFLSKCNFKDYEELNSQLKQYQTGLISRD